MATTDTAIERIDRVWHAAFENGHLDVVDEAMAREYVARTPGSKEPIRGPEGFEEYLRMLRTAFPDLSVTVEDRIVGEDAVVDRYRIEGTHDGEFMGVPPPGGRWRSRGPSSTTSREGGSSRTSPSWTPSTCFTSSGSTHPSRKRPPTGSDRRQPQAGSHRCVIPPAASATGVSVADSPPGTS